MPRRTPGVSPNSTNVNVLYKNSADGANVFSGFHFNNSGSGQNRISYMGAFSESAANRKQGFVIGTDNGVTRAERLRITGDGNVGIGTTAPTSTLHVVGNFLATGSIVGANIAATYQDLAEWVPATQDLAPGEVVVLNPDANNQVMPSLRPRPVRNSDGPRIPRSRSSSRS